MKAVIFDLDETLIRSRIDFKKMKSEVIKFLQSAGVTRDLLNVGMLNFEITRVGAEDLRGKGSTEEEIRQVLARVTQIMNRVELESLEEATLIEGVPETLRSLKAEGLKIGIMTRSCREYTERVLAKFGLRDYIDSIAARDDVENPKPNPEHAIYLLRLLGVSAREALLVGDHWLDGLCAKDANVRFILFRRREQSLEPPKEYQYQTIDNMEELVKIISDKHGMPRQA